MSLDLLTYLKDYFANYICQLLFFLSKETTQFNFFKLIILNYEEIINNYISFNCFCNLIETKLNSSCEEYLIIFIKKEMNSINLQELIKKNTKKNIYKVNYLRILECLIVKNINNDYRIKDSDNNSNNYFKINFIFDYIVENLYNLIKIRQGFFLVRKICKLVKDKNTQIRIVEKICYNIKFFTSNANGCLLCQCILRNFSIKECFNERLVNKKFDTDNIYEWIKKSTFIIETCSNKISSNLDTKINKEQKPATYNINNNVNNNNKLIDNNNIDISKYSKENYNLNNNPHKNHDYNLNPSLLLFYSYLVNELFNSELKSYTLKIIECAIEYNSPIFHIRILEQFLNCNYNENIKKFLNNEKSYKVLFYLAEKLDNKKQVIFYNTIVGYKYSVYQQFNPIVIECFNKLIFKLENFLGNKPTEINTYNNKLFSLKENIINNNLNNKIYNNYNFCNILYPKNNVQLYSTCNRNYLNYNNNFSNNYNNIQHCDINFNVSNDTCHYNINYFQNKNLNKHYNKPNYLIKNVNHNELKKSNKLNLVYNIKTSNNNCIINKFDV